MCTDTFVCNVKLLFFILVILFPSEMLKLPTHTCMCTLHGSSSDLSWDLSDR